jgi:hypothetical protein
MNNGYIFRGYINFMMFCRVNIDKLFLSSDPADMEVLKNQVNVFLKSAQSISGGCPCNKNKRRQTAHKAYKDTVEMLSGNEEMSRRITDLLNGAEEVLFLFGRDDGNPQPKEESSFATIHKPTTNPAATPSVPLPATETSGRQPPAPPGE